MQQVNFTAEDIHEYLTPSKCERRPFLRSNAMPESPPDEFAQLLMRLGKAHESAHLMTLGPYFDCRAVGNIERQRRTQLGIEAREPIIYQPYFSVANVPSLNNYSVSGICDFLILRPEGYVLRDAKLSKNINRKDHPEIYAQMSLYGWLFEKMFGFEPYKLEVLNGKNEIISIVYDNGAEAMTQLTEILSYISMKEEPYTPVGQSKCGPCGYHKRCWTTAIEKSDVGIVYGLNLSMGRVLHSQGVDTLNQLVDKFTVEQLASVKVPHGTSFRKIGKSAETIISHARALLTRSSTLIGNLALPPSKNYVMFDLEGLPPFADHLEKIYLWGMQVYGETVFPYRPALAGFGVDGDKEGWTQFLRIAANILEDHGPIPFIHWANYEKVKIKLYQDRFGDPDGIAGKVLAQCVDLKTIVTAAIVLPTHGYGLKELEKQAGFKRTMDEFGGAWSIARYIEACETNDQQLRTEVMDKVIKYNEEDLAATWAVMNWVRAFHNK